MSDPLRRRNVKITRGKKSDKKKKKIESRNRASLNQIDGFTEIREKMSQQREKLIRGETSTIDKGLLHEPSPVFFEKTRDIRSNKKAGDGKTIILNNPDFEEGIDVSTVIKERTRVINGNKSRVFHELYKQFQENQSNLKQDMRKSPTEALENARKQEEKSKRIAFEEAEKKRVAKELEKQKEVERLERIELEKQKEVERLESERLERIELEKQKEIERLETLKQERLESERLERIELEKQKEVERLEAITSNKQSQDSDLSSKKKRSFWAWLRRIFSFKPKRQEIMEIGQIQNQALSESKDFEEVEDITIPEEAPVAEAPVEQVPEIKIQVEEFEEEEEAEEAEEESEIETYEEIVEEFEEEEEVEEEDESKIETYEEIVEEFEEEEEVEEAEDESEIETYEEIVEEVQEEVEEEEVEEESPIVETPVEQVSETENQAEEVEDESRDDNEEVILSVLRKAIREEPRPIEFIEKILMETHDISKKDVKIIINQVASPFSICKTINDDAFYRFISSLEDEKVSGGGVEIWTKVIQTIGLDQISEDQQVEIYNMFMGHENNVNRRIKAFAILYHFLPAKFEKWWQKEMISDFTLRKYNSDYKFFRQKNFTNNLIDEARMLLCAYALEKPNLVAKEYTIARHQAGQVHENKTEKWLKKGNRQIEYLTEEQIRNTSQKKYGEKYLSNKITPDLLLKIPIQLYHEGQHIHWIDAKKQFIDPALSPENRINNFCEQLEKYVRAYGPGLIVWGKDFSEEWNEATEGVVQHIKI